MMEQPNKEIANKTGYYTFLYHGDIMRLREQGYHTYITSDTGFTACCAVYRLKATLNYMLKKYR